MITSINISWIAHQCQPLTLHRSSCLPMPILTHRSQAFKCSSSMEFVLAWFSPTQMAPPTHRSTMAQSASSQSKIGPWLQMNISIAWKSTLKHYSLVQTGSKFQPSCSPQIQGILSLVGLQKYLLIIQINSSDTPTLMEMMKAWPILAQLIQVSLRWTNTSSSSRSSHTSLSLIT